MTRMSMAGEPVLFLGLAIGCGWQRDWIAPIQRRQWRQMSKLDRRTFARLRRRFNARLVQG